MAPYTYGYRRAGKGCLVVEDTEARPCGRCSGAFGTETVRGVCITLNAKGCRTRSGKPWANPTIRRILGNPVYAGDLIYNKRDTSVPGRVKFRPVAEHIRYEGGVPAIIDRATFEEAQAILKRVPSFPHGAQASNYILSGLVKCGKCGANMVGHSHYGRNRKEAPPVLPLLALHAEGASHLSGQQHPG